MPSGRTHDRLAWISTLPLAGIVAWLGRWDLALAAAAGALFGGLWFSGDLDTVSRPLKRWGPLAWIWRPYRALVPHRGVHSHGLVWGPFFRLAYLALVLALLAGTVSLLARLAGHVALADRFGHGLGGFASALAQVDRWLLAAFVAGVFYGNAVHSLTDWTVSGAKRLRRLGRARRRGKNQKLG